MPYKYRKKVRTSSSQIIKHLMGADPEELVNVVSSGTSRRLAEAKAVDEIKLQMDEVDDLVDVDDLVNVDDDEKEDAMNIGEVSLRSELCNWSIRHNITNDALGGLLGILIRHNMPLPKDPRTLKATPRVAPIKKICGGEYVAYGLRRILEESLKTSRQPPQINVNIDGLPLSKSSSLQVWPILINIHATDDVHFVRDFFFWKQ